MSRPDSDPIARLCRTGQHLPARLRADIVGLGEAAVPHLIALLDEDTPLLEDVPDPGWPPIHAVDLLVDLRAAAAIEPLLDVLITSELDEIIYSRLVLRLPELGAPVLEPALARFPPSIEADAYAALCFVVAKLGVQDERIYAHLLRLFDHHTVLGSIALADYGDVRALPLLAGAIGDYEYDPDSIMPPDIMDLAQSYEILRGGPLPADLQTRVAEVRAAWLGRGASPAPSAKIGRNDPCPCGSGKKHKRCCLGLEA